MSKSMAANEGRPQAYVGISGVAYANDAYKLEEIANEHGIIPHRLLLLGVKATHKTQYLDVPNKYGDDWYPVGQRMDNAVGTTEHQFGVVQAYLDPTYVSDQQYRTEFMNKVIGRAGRWARGVQFDLLPWHVDDGLKQLTHCIQQSEPPYGSPFHVLLQCHKEAMDTLGPKGIVKRLGEFAAGLTYVIFDASHGKGKRLDTGTLDPFLEEAYASDQLSRLGIAIAGGLDAEVVHDVMPGLLVKYPHLSWDAEGKLHPLRQDGSRPLDLAIAKGYLVASADVLGY